MSMKGEPQQVQRLRQYVQAILQDPPPPFGKGKKHAVYRIRFEGQDYVLKVQVRPDWHQWCRQVGLQLSDIILHPGHGHAWGSRWRAAQSWQHESAVMRAWHGMGLPSLKEVPLGLPYQRLTYFENLCNLKEYLRRPDRCQPSGLGDLPLQPTLQDKYHMLGRVLQSLGCIHQTLQRYGAKAFYQLDAFVSNVLVDRQRVIFIDAEYQPDQRCSHRQLQAAALQGFLFSVFKDLPMSCLDTVLQLSVEHYPDRQVLWQIVQNIAKRRFGFLRSGESSDYLGPGLLGQRLRHVLSRSLFLLLAAWLQC